jgi:hypothetical protein
MERELELLVERDVLRHDLHPLARAGQDRARRVTDAEERAAKTSAAGVCVTGPSKLSPVAPSRIWSICRFVNTTCGPGESSSRCAIAVNASGTEPLRQSRVPSWLYATLVPAISSSGSSSRFAIEGTDGHTTPEGSRRSVRSQTSSPSFVAAVVAAQRVSRPIFSERPESSSSKPTITTSGMSRASMAPSPSSSVSCTTSGMTTESSSPYAHRTLSARVALGHRRRAAITSEEKDR